jgi:RNase P subunit RPR2
MAILRDASARRAVANRIKATWRTSKCPACDQGLKRKVIPYAETTILLCTQCSWIHQIPFIMDEGNEMGRSYVPGVTGRRTPTVVFKADGTIREIR